MKSKTEMTTVTGNLSVVEKRQPKPSKAEIIEALVQRSYLKAKAEHEAWLERDDAFKARIEALIVDHMKANIEAMVPSTFGHYHKGEVGANYVFTSPEIKALVEERYSIPRPHWTREEARDAIKANLARPVNLLEDPEACKAMDAMLAAWNI